MSVGTCVTIKDLDNICVLISKLEIEIESLLKNFNFTMNDDVVKVGVDEIKKKLVVFMENVNERN